WAASCMSLTPTGVEPVKETLRRRESFIRGPEMAEAEEPAATLSTPAGRPASRMPWAKSREGRGVRWAGLSTTGRPAATAGATLRVAMASGKFHGVISSDGPTGLCVTIILFLPSGEVK